MVFLDNALNKKWERYLGRGLWFESYHEGKIILGDGCVYWIEVEMEISNISAQKPDQ
ncbi:hypothetical protein OCC_11864 [Thermococcus litoralis DSM 5473]|uniref:Uncharacterized protein n=1 Tax=Thermococcus litoralis (strain ATCC 51850 / DSM 5473 / JCM 8560 / NS-C) TaxID=523849 RepID=H3ZNY8_THELN|nr:hypothetical protein OCC_11864 [Thermococcus litoralis DSM 5473]